MGNFIEVDKVKEFKDGSKKRIAVQGKEVLLARIGDSYYAVGNLCTHLEGNLSRGKLEDTIITCPLHGTQFDLRDGRVVRWLQGYGQLSQVSEEFKSSRALQTYDVRVEGDTILIEI